MSSLSMSVSKFHLPGSPVVKTSLSNAECVGLIPGLGAKNLNPSWPKKKKKKYKIEAVL